MQSLLSFGKIKMFILEDGKELPYHYNDYFSAEVQKQMMMTTKNVSGITVHV